LEAPVPTPIRVLLADDHVMVREVLAQFLNESGCAQVMGQAADAEQVFEVAVATQPDVIVLDYGMPRSNALTTIETLLVRVPRAKVVVLTVHENIHYAVKVLESGAHGYVVKSAAVTELVDALKAVSAGEVYISTKVSLPVIKHLRQPRRERLGMESLSQREFEILRMLGTGMSLKECASHLDISASSASTYRARVMEKLKLNTTADLIRFALENDIVG
jgi:DNA-binding NarL/FixJ family response regulator